MSTEQAVVEFLGKVLAYGGGGATVAFLLFRFLGEKWIENKFAQRLDLLKHEHAKEIERLRLEINTLLSRVTKLHEREFTVVPEAWSRLQEALWRLKSFVSVFQSYPDLERMSDERLEEFLGASELLKSEKKAIRESRERNKTYQEIIFWHDLRGVKSTYSEFHKYLEKHCLFMPPDIRKAFSDVDDKMWDVLLKREIGKQIDDFPKWVEASRQMRNEIEPELRALEETVQKKLQGEARA
jgi:hypothetical protein